MKRFVRLSVVIILAAVLSLWGRDAVREVVESGFSSLTEQIESSGEGFASGESDWAVRKSEHEHRAAWQDFPALTQTGFEFSAAREVSPASRVRNFSEERGGNNAGGARCGFLRSGSFVCTARPANFMMDRLFAPVGGALSGLSAAVSLRRLRI